MKITEDDRMGGSLQDSILSLLTFSTDYCKTIRGAVTPRIFESSIYKEIAGVAIDFIDRYGEPVGEHLPDHLEHILTGDDKRKAASYKRTIEDLFIAKDGINGDYVTTQLNKFVRQQNLKSAFLQAAEEFEAGRIDEVEVILGKALKHQVVAFESGIDLADPSQALAFLDHPEEALLTGIKALDRFGVGPAPKTLYLVTGPLGAGKSWWLMQIGKYALLQRRVVVHITLEMSAEKTVQRYLQMLFSVTKKQGGATIPRIIRDEYGGLKTIEFQDLELPSLEDENIREHLARKITRRLGRRSAFKVKKFASGSLTIPALNAYLDGLERFEGLVADVLIIDYAELMQLGKGSELRGSIGQLFVDLRGIADERNLALVTASQVNRVGIGKTTSGTSDLSEDISKAFTADTVVTYNQTAVEQKNGMARLFVAKNRDGEDKMTALIAQGYKMGQFCTDSILMDENYMPATGRNFNPREDSDDGEDDKRDRAREQRRARRPEPR